MEPFRIAAFGVDGRTVVMVNGPVAHGTIVDSRDVSDLKKHEPFSAEEEQLILSLRKAGKTFQAIAVQLDRDYPGARSAVCARYHKLVDGMTQEQPTACKAPPWG